MYYFDATGVQQATFATTNMNVHAIIAAVEDSWVLVDIDLGPSSQWLPERWIIPCAGLVWTSSPNAFRMNHFQKQIQSSTWYMRPWSWPEIDAVMYDLSFGLFSSLPY